MGIYHAPVLAKLVDGIVTDAVSDNVTNNMIEKAIQNAINNTIVIPFQTWILNTWIRFSEISHIACLVVASVGIIMFMVGVEKGRKIAIVAVLSYLGIQLLNWVIMGG